MVKMISRIVFFVLMTLYANIQFSDAYEINIKSGNYSIGQQEGYIQVMGVPYYDLVQSSGVSLRNAYVLATPSYWSSQNIDALWIGANINGYSPSGSYQYLTRFNLPENIDLVNITLKYRGDDITIPQMNGINLTNYGAGPFNDSMPAFLSNDITSLIHSGENILSFIVINSNLGLNPTGVQFSANIEYETTPVPEPSAIMLMCTGLIVVTGYCRIKLKKRLLS